KTTSLNFSAFLLFFVEMSARAGVRPFCPYNEVCARSLESEWTDAYHHRHSKCGLETVASGNRESVRMAGDDPAGSAAGFRVGAEICSRAAGSHDLRGISRARGDFPDPSRIPRGRSVRDVRSHAPAQSDSQPPSWRLSRSLEGGQVRVLHVRCRCQVAHEPRRL